MKLLLDTHAFLWFSEDHPDLSPTAREHIEDTANTCFISMGTIWEMAIKISIGKLKLGMDLENLAEELRTRGFQLLPISVDHAIRVAELDFYHRDPFDRLLIAQALTEECALISNEEVFDAYGVERIW